MVPVKQTAYVFFGLIGSGKSYLASRWAARYRLPCFNTDVERKTLAGIAPWDRSGKENLYSQDFTRRTYDRMCERARMELQTRQASGVVLDGSYSMRAERTRILRELAPVRILFIYCHCSEEVTRARLRQRQNDPAAVSDGTYPVYLLQKEKFEPPTELPSDLLVLLDTDASVEYLVRYLQQTLHPCHP